MRKFLKTAQAVLSLILVICVLLEPSLAQASHGDGMFHWRNFGVDKAYASRQDAINDAYNRFVEGGMPQEAARQLAQTMKAQPCKRIVLNNGEHLDFMMSGHGMHRNVQVDFVRPGAHGMQYAAPACEWQIEYEGVVYAGIIPDVCNNLSLIIIGPECVYTDTESRGLHEDGQHWAEWDVNDVCLAYRYVDHRHAVDNGKGWIIPKLGDCECTLDQLQDETGQRPGMSGRIPLHGKIVQWRHSRRLMAFCQQVDNPGEAPFSSGTALVRWKEHYQLDQNGVYSAEVEYSSPATVEEVQQLGEMNLWFWARNEQIYAAIFAGETAR